MPEKISNLLVSSVLFIGLKLNPLGTLATIWSVVLIRDEWWWWICRGRWNKWQGKPKYSEENCPSATLCTTNPTWPKLGWTRASALGSRRLNIAAKAQPGYIVFLVYLSGWSRTESTVTEATYWLFYQPWLVDGDDCTAVGGMNVGRGNRSTRRKPDPISLCPPQVPHDMTRARTCDAAVGSN
jgi:hypothetical protein